VRFGLVGDAHIAPVKFQIDLHGISLQHMSDLVKMSKRLITRSTT
jgi:hypothetical protein